MSAKINLLIKEKKGPTIISVKNKLSSGLLIFFVILFLATTGIYIYWLSLTKERDSLQRAIEISSKDIASYKNIEEEKSNITIKVKELEKLTENRFDYIKAIDDVQRLFGYSLSIHSFEVDADGLARINATKQDKLTFANELALDTNISTIELTLNVSSSEELQEAVDSLRFFHGKGLTSATVVNTTRSEEGGYEVDFILNLQPNS